MLAGSNHHRADGDDVLSLEGVAKERVGFVRALARSEVVGSLEVRGEDGLFVDEIFEIDGLGSFHVGRSQVGVVDDDVFAFGVLVAGHDVFPLHGLASAGVLTLIANRREIVAIELVEMDLARLLRGVHGHGDLVGGRRLIDPDQSGARASHCFLVLGVSRPGLGVSGAVPWILGCVLGGHGDPFSGLTIGQLLERRRAVCHLHAVCPQRTASSNLAPR